MACVYLEWGWVVGWGGMCVFGMGMGGRVGWHVCGIRFAFLLCVCV